MDNLDPLIRLARQRGDESVSRLLLEKGTKLSPLEIEREVSSLNDDSWITVVPAKETALEEHDHSLDTLPRKIDV